MKSNNKPKEAFEIIEIHNISTNSGKVQAVINLLRIWTSPLRASSYLYQSTVDKQEVATYRNNCISMRRLFRFSLLWLIASMVIIVLATSTVVEVYGQNPTITPNPVTSTPTTKPTPIPTSTLSPDQRLTALEDQIADVKKNDVPIFEILIALMSLVVGFALNEVAQGLRARAAEKKQIEAVRTLISIEAAENISLLRIFTSEVEEIANNFPDGLGIEYQDKNGHIDKRKGRLLWLMRDLHKLSFPDWSFKALDSQLSKLPIAFSRDEINAIYRERSQLQRVTNTYRKISARIVKRQEELDDLLGENWIKLKNKLQNTMDLLEKQKIQRQIDDLEQRDEWPLRYYQKDILNLWENFDEACKAVGVTIWIKS